MLNMKNNNNIKIASKTEDDMMVKMLTEKLQNIELNKNINSEEYGETCMDSVQENKKDITYICTYCGFTLKSKSKHNHYKSCIGVQAYNYLIGKKNTGRSQCVNCELTFLTKHIKEHQSKPCFKPDQINHCEYCQMDYGSKRHKCKVSYIVQKIKAGFKGNIKEECSHFSHLTEKEKRMALNEGKPKQKKLNYEEFLREILELADEYEKSIQPDEDLLKQIEEDEREVQQIMKRQALEEEIREHNEIVNLQLKFVKLNEQREQEEKIMIEKLKKWAQEARERDEKRKKELELTKKEKIFKMNWLQAKQFTEDRYFGWLEEKLTSVEGGKQYLKSLKWFSRADQIKWMEIKYEQINKLDQEKIFQMEFKAIQTNNFDEIEQYLFKKPFIQIIKMEPVKEKRDLKLPSKKITKWTEEESKKIKETLNNTKCCLTSEQLHEAIKNSTRGFVEYSHTSKKWLQKTRQREPEIQHSVYDLKKEEIKTEYQEEIEKLKIKHPKASLQTFYESKVCPDEEMKKYKKALEEIKFKYGKKLLDLKNGEEMDGKRKLEKMERDEFRKRI